MFVIDFYTENIDLYVYILEKETGKIIACFDGKNSIPSKFNFCKVVRKKYKYKSNTLYLFIDKKGNVPAESLIRLILKNGISSFKMSARREGGDIYYIGIYYDYPVTIKYDTHNEVCNVWHGVTGKLLDSEKLVNWKYL